VDRIHQMVPEMPLPQIEATLRDEEAIQALLVTRLEQAVEKATADLHKALVRHCNIHLLHRSIAPAQLCGFGMRADHAQGC
jgi:hypothetical protein